MIEKLHGIVEDISGLNSKLVLLIGPPRSGKSKISLGQLAARRQTRVLRSALTLGVNRDRANHAKTFTGG